MILAPIKISYAELSFILQWSLATFLAFLLSLLFVEIGVREDLGILQAAIASLLVAFAQVFVLQERVFPGWWVLSSCSAWITITLIGIGTIGWIVPNTTFLVERFFYSLIFGACGGSIIGFFQWLTIRYRYPRSSQWILTTTIAWSLGSLVGSLIGMSLHIVTEIFFAEIIGLACTWVVVGVVTGVGVYHLWE